MPNVPSKGDGILNLSVSIGQCVDVVSNEERRVTGKLPPQGNRLVRRWQTYLAMCTARNIVPLLEHRLMVEYNKIEHGGGNVEELAELEEELMEVRSTYKRLKRRNDRLRKGRLYLSLSSLMQEELKKRGIRV